MFYNVPSRRNALKNASEEYSRLLDIVTRYAVHNPTVSITCKKVALVPRESRDSHAFANQLTQCVCNLARLAYTRHPHAIGLECDR